MRIILRFILPVFVLSLIVQSTTVLANSNTVFASSQIAKVTNSDVNAFSQNDILFYEPEECISGSISGSCGGEMIPDCSVHRNERIREVAEKYGPLLMNLQIAYGIPWELMIANMIYESQVGCEGTAKDQMADGKYNWIGLTCGSSDFVSTSKYANGITKYWRPQDEIDRGGSCYESYDSMELMFKSYASGDFARNGYYDKAIQMYNGDNLAEFLAEYYTTHVGRTMDVNDDYVQVSLAAIKDVIWKVAEEKGWPTSAELQKQYDIPIGGRFPIGTPKGEIYDDTVSCSSSGGLGNSASNTTSEAATGNNITWIGDSYSIGAGASIMNAFPGIQFGTSVGNANSYIQSNKGVSARYCGGGDENAAECIDNPPALTILKNIIKKGDLKPYLVMAVGTNAGWTDEEVEEFKSIMSSHPETKVIFVTAKAKANLMSDDNGTNDRLRRLVESNDNYYLADWAATYDDSYFAENDTHPTANGGYERWVAVIKDAVDEAAPSSGYQDTTTWSDGWITGGFDGYQKEPAEGSGYALAEESVNGGHTQEYLTDGKPNKILLHSTEGGPGEGNSGLALYGDVCKEGDGGGCGITPAHFTIDLKNKKLYQHYSINKPSDAIIEDLDGGIQIEIIGFMNKGNYPSLPDFTNEDWEYLAKLLISLSNQTGIKLTSTADWSHTNRYSEEEFRNYTGVLGHMHAPSTNNHDDPGDIWSKVESTINRILVTDNINYCKNTRNYSGFAATVVDYAWTIDELTAMGTNEWDGILTAKPAYQEVYDRRVSEGKYVGSLASAADCGGFVTTLMNESGYAPDYNYSGYGGWTGTQAEWLAENWDFIGISGEGFDTAQLRQGDVFIKSQLHTYVFVGDIEGFGSNIASASLNHRAPQAGGNSASESGYSIYRKREL